MKTRVQRFQHAAHQLFLKCRAQSYKIQRKTNSMFAKLKRQI